MDVCRDYWGRRFRKFKVSYGQDRTKAIALFGGTPEGGGLAQEAYLLFLSLARG